MDNCSKATPRYICELCKLEDIRSNLVSACECSKKNEDRGLVHVSCIENLVDVECDQTKVMPTCPFCFAEFNIHSSYFEFRFDISKLLSLRSICSVCELSIMFLTVVVFLAFTSLLWFDFDMHPLPVLIFLLICITMSYRALGDVWARLNVWRRSIFKLKILSK
jgi:hypothetical protein